MLPLSLLSKCKTVETKHRVNKMTVSNESPLVSGLYRPWWCVREIQPRLRNSAWWTPLTPAQRKTHFLQVSLLTPAQRETRFHQVSQHRHFRLVFVRLTFLTSIRFYLEMNTIRWMSWLTCHTLTSVHFPPLLRYRTFLPFWKVASGFLLGLPTVLQKVIRILTSNKTH